MSNGRGFEIFNRSCISPVEEPLCFVAEVIDSAFALFRMDSPSSSIIAAEAAISVSNVGPYNLTVHSKWLPLDVTDTFATGTGCDDSVIGGVYDPYYACSFDSDNIESCQFLRRLSDHSHCVPNGAECQFYPTRFGCEIGDWSCQFQAISNSSPENYLDSQFSSTFEAAAPLISDYCVSPGSDGVRNSWSSVLFENASSSKYCAKLIQIPCEGAEEMTLKSVIRDVAGDILESVDGGVEAVVERAAEFLDQLSEL